MRFGLFFLPLASSQSEARVEYDRMLAECVEADAQGWDSAWFTEHHFDPYGGIVPSPFVIMAAVARLTQHLRLGTAVSVLPLVDPIRLAEEAAMVDILSNGRVDLGVGRGFMAHEFAAVSLSSEQRDARVLDGWRTIRDIWAEQGASYQGETVRFQSLRMMPRPVQSPHPPLWMAASVSRQSFETAGRHGFHLMLNPYNRTQDELDRGLAVYREAAEEAGFAWETRRVLVNFPLLLAESGAAARAEAREPFSRYLATMEAAFQRNGTGKRISSDDYDTIAAKVLFGAPDDVIEKLRTWQAWGATDVSLMSRFADLPFEAAERSRDLLIHRVAPHLR
ncbi:MAG: LLM class flavin-dependent oxidoreductase [Acetobacteraceae bacterium]